MRRKILIAILLIILTGLLIMMGITIHRLLTDAPPPSPAEPAAQPAEPEPTEIPEDAPQSQWFTYEDNRFTFLYNPSRTEVTGEGTTVSAVSLDGSLPRMDLQTVEIEQTPEEADFLFLARVALASYFAETPDMESLKNTELSSEGGFRAAFSIAATETSDALTAQVRLTDGVLMILLLPESLPTDQADYWQQVLDTVKLN